MQGFHLLQLTLVSLNPIKDLLLRKIVSDVNQNTQSLILSTKVEALNLSLKGGDPAAPSGTATLLRLHPSHWFCLRHLPPLRVSSATLGTPNSHGVTGGVYKTRVRIHRDILIRDY